MQLLCHKRFSCSVLTKKELVRRSVSPALCPPSKPEKQQPCNRLPCPAYWQEMPWTPVNSLAFAQPSNYEIFISELKLDKGTHSQNFAQVSN